MLFRSDTADELIPIHISLTGDNDYHSSSFNDASTRSHSPLIAEWVGVKAFSPTRTGEQPDYEGPRIASMELTEDTLPRVSTRATVPAGVRFRLIVFRKSGNNYVFQSVADYASNGTGTPVLERGKLLTRSGTIRVVGYSFNTTADLGDMPSTYAYNSSTVSEHVFNPPPKVKSAVIRMTRNETKELGCDEKLFKQVVKTTFNQRRKTLRNSIKPILGKDCPLTENILFNKRPEQLSVAEFIDLTNKVEEALKTAGNNL